MKIKRTSQVSGVTRTLDLDVTRQQLIQWESGASIQSVMGHLTPSEREFIITGITDEEWKRLYDR